MTTIDVTNDPRTSVSAFRWRALGSERLTIVVKLTCSFASGRAEIMSPEPIRLESAHLDGAPAKSLLEATDLVPYLGRAEVFFRGRSFARAGSCARLSVLRGREMLLDKRVVAARHDPAGIPIMYERAHGGSGFAANPIGTGVAQGSPAPDFTHSSDPRLPATFLPVPIAWPHRASVMSEAHRAGLHASPIAIGQAFPWAALQAAPPDQQLARIDPGDVLLLENLIAGEASARITVPAFGVLSEVSPTMAVPAPRLDTVRIDGERKTLALSYRTVVAVADPSARLSVKVSLSVPVAFDMLGSTMMKTGDADDAAAKRPVAPFPIGAPKKTNGEHHAAASELRKQANVQSARPGQMQTVGLRIDRDLVPPVSVPAPVPVPVPAHASLPVASLAPPMSAPAVAAAAAAPLSQSAPSPPPPKGPSLGARFLDRRKKP